MRHPTKILRPEVDSFGVASINERYDEMNDSYNEQRYGESINYARSMIESTCKWIYKVLEDKEINDGKYIGLNKMAKETFRSLESELSAQEHVKEIFGQLIDIITEIGNLRNATSVSHGSAVRTRPITPVEARFVIFAAEDITMTLLNLCFNKTHSLKRNAVHSVISDEGMEKIKIGDGFINYKFKNEIGAYNTSVEFSTFENNNVIYQVVITLPSWVNADTDQEFMSEHIRDYMEDDAIELGKNGIRGYIYFSPKKDFKYDVQIEKNVIYISKI